MKAPLTRRGFARNLTIAAAGAAILAPQSTLADEPKAPAAADQLLAMLQARYPERLNDDQWKQVRGKIEGQLRAAVELRKFALKNADEPATVFAAYRKS